MQAHVCLSGHHRRGLCGASGFGWLRQLRWHFLRAQRAQPCLGVVPGVFTLGNEIGESEGSSPESGVFEKERVTPSTSSGRAGCLGRETWPQPLAVSYNRPRFSTSRNARGTFFFFLLGRCLMMTGNMTRFSIKCFCCLSRSDDFCLCYEVGVAPHAGDLQQQWPRLSVPGALAWVSAHPRRHRRGVVLGCLQRIGDRKGQGIPPRSPPAQQDGCPRLPRRCVCGCLCG